MFLKQLYQHSKGLFLVLVLFVIAFVFLNLKWGMVATPVYQYGMFSGPVHLEDTLHLTQVEVNGEAVDMSEQHFVSKDKMLVMPQKYLSALLQNDAVHTTMQSFFSKFGLASLVALDAEDTLVNPRIFMGWYQHQLRAVLHKNIDSIQIVEQRLVWDGNKLLSLEIPKKMNAFVYP